MSQQTAKQPSAVPQCGGLFQHPHQVDLVLDFGGQSSAREVLQRAFSACVFDQPVLHFQEVADFLKHNLGVRFSNGIEPVTEELIEQG